MMKKRLITALLCIALLGSLVPAASATEPEEPGQFISYEVPGGYLYFDPDTGSIVGATDTVREAIIPEEIAGVPVRSIGDSAFWFCSDLKAVSLPESLTQIEANGFNHCTSLTKVELPKQLTYLGRYAFYDCESLKEISIPDTLQTMEDCALIGTAWLDAQTDEFVIVGDGVLVDYNCEAQTVAIPAGVKTISSAFYKNETMTAVQIPEGVTALYGSFAFAAQLAQVTFPQNSLRCIGIDAFSYTKNLHQIEIPASVQEVGEGAFSNSGLTSAPIPETVETWGNNVYAHCDQLVFVTVPGTMSNLPSSMFSNCSNLENVVMEEGVQRIGFGAFSECTALTKITFPRSLVAVGYNGLLFTPWLERQTDEFVIVGGGVLVDYHGTGGDVKIPEGVVFVNECFVPREGSGPSADDVPLKSIQFPSTLREIGSYSFCWTELKQIEIPQGVTAIGTEAFTGCRNLTRIILPDSMKVIGNGAFAACENVTTIELGNGLEEIGPNAFQYCGFTELVLPASLRRISTGAFRGCQKLKTLVAVPGVQEVGASAFAKTALQQVTLPASVQTVGVNAFTGAPLKTLTVLNPNCRLSPWLLQADYNDYDPQDMPAAVIRGYPGSTAEAYAALYDSLTFEALSGDPDDDITPYDGRFTDVRETDWFYEAVKFGFEHNLIQGVAATRFGPGQKMERAMLVTVLYRMAGEPEVQGTCPFTDVPDNAYYKDAVVWAAHNGIIEGVGGNLFRPKGYTTRQQIAAIFYRYLQAEPVTYDMSRFPDSGSIAGWARESMTWAVSVGLFQGYREDGTLRPNQNATRSEVVQLFQRVMENSL